MCNNELHFGTFKKLICSIHTLTLVQITVWIMSSQHLLVLRLINELSFKSKNIILRIHWGSENCLFKTWRYPAAHHKSFFHHFVFGLNCYTHTQTKVRLTSLLMISNLWGGLAVLSGQGPELNSSRDTERGRQGGRGVYVREEVDSKYCKSNLQHIALKSFTDSESILSVNSKGYESQVSVNKSIQVSCTGLKVSKVF